MVDQWRLQSALSEFAETLVSTYDVGEVLYRFSDHVTDVLDIDGSGVSVLDESGHLRFVTATNAVVERVERVQEQYGQGPCVEATAKEMLLAITDLKETHDRWDPYLPEALDAGLRSVLAVPMRANDQTIGALNAYHSEPREWTREEVAAVSTLSDMATAYVLLAGQVQTSQERADQLQHALNSRVVVEQAKGILASRNDEPLEDAFQRLRNHARSRNATVHQVARDIVDGELKL